MFIIVTVFTLDSRDSVSDDDISDELMALDDAFEQLLPLLLCLFKYSRLHFIHLFQSELVIHIRLMVKEVRQSAHRPRS